MPNALGLKKELKVIYEDKDNFGNSSFFEGNKNNNIVSIEVINLYEFVIEKNIRNIEAIKIDVEGYEDQALKDFISKSKEEELPKLIIHRSIKSNKIYISFISRS